MGSNSAATRDRDAVMGYIRLGTCHMQACKHKSCRHRPDLQRTACPQSFNNPALCGASL